MKCIHAFERFGTEETDTEQVRCAIFRDAIGPGDSIVQAIPKGVAFCKHVCDMRNRPTTDLPTCPIMLAAMRRMLDHICRRGEIPKWKLTVDMAAAFARYRALAGDAPARELFTKMYLTQTAVKEADGGLPLEDLRTRFREIAKNNDMEDILDAFAAATRR